MHPLKSTGAKTLPPLVPAPFHFRVSRDDLRLACIQAGIKRPGGKIRYFAGADFKAFANGAVYSQLPFMLIEVSCQRQQRLAVVNLVNVSIDSVHRPFSAESRRIIFAFKSSIQHARTLAKYRSVITTERHLTSRCSFPVRKEYTGFNATASPGDSRNAWQKLLLDVRETLPELSPVLIGEEYAELSVLLNRPGNLAGARMLFRKDTNAQRLNHIANTLTRWHEPFDTSLSGYSPVLYFDREFQALMNHYEHQAPGAMYLNVVPMLGNVLLGECRADVERNYDRPLTTLEHDRLRFVLSAVLLMSFEDPDAATAGPTYDRVGEYLSIQNMPDRDAAILLDTAKMELRLAWSNVIPHIHVEDVIEIVTVCMLSMPPAIRKGRPPLSIIK